MVIEDRRFGSDMRALQDALVEFAEELARRRAREQESRADKIEPEPLVAPERTHEPEPPAPEEAAPVRLGRQIYPPASAPPPSTAATQPPASAQPEPVTTDVRRWFIAVAAAGVVVGIVTAVSALTFGEAFLNYHGFEVVLRTGEFAGLLPSVLGGSALAIAGLFGLSPNARPAVVGGCLFLATLLFFVRLSEISAVDEYCDCARDISVGYTLSWLPAVGLIALAIVALVRWRPRQRTAWVPLPLLGWTVGLAAAWGASLLIPIYDKDGTRYGDAFSSLGPWSGLWTMLAAASVVVAIYCGLRYLPPDAGGGPVLAAAVIPLIAVINEVAYLLGGPEDPTNKGLIWLMVLPALAVVALCVVAFVRSRERPGTEFVDSDALG